MQDVNCEALGFDPAEFLARVGLKHPVGETGRTADIRRRRVRDAPGQLLAGVSGSVAVFDIKAMTGDGSDPEFKTLPIAEWAGITTGILKPGNPALAPGSVFRTRVSKIPLSSPFIFIFPNAQASPPAMRKSSMFAAVSSSGGSRSSGVTSRPCRRAQRPKTGLADQREV
ncbi:hypothetical protein VB636_11550, partial [Paracoccus sp. APAP_BH8]